MTGEDDILAMESTGPESFITPGPGFTKDRDVFQASMKRYGRPAQFGGGEGAREPKARRKDPRGGQGSSLWDAMGPQVRLQKDELVDTALVEQLRNRESWFGWLGFREWRVLTILTPEFGDPFDDSALKKYAGASA